MIVEDGGHLFAPSVAKCLASGTGGDGIGLDDLMVVTIMNEFMSASILLLSAVKRLYCTDTCKNESAVLEIALVGDETQSPQQLNNSYLLC